MSIDDSDVFHCNNDLWKTAPERENGNYQGIDASDNRNTTRIRVGAGNRDSSVAADKAIADVFGDGFFTPPDFELLESHMPFYQSALGDRLEYELTFNDYSRVIQAAGDANASYHIGGISLEYDMVTLPELAQMIDNQYKGRLAILYDRVLRHRKMTMDKSNTLWNINLNVPASSMKGINSTVKGCAPIRCGTADKQRYEGTAGESLASPDASSGGGHEETGRIRQQPAAPDRVQNYRERLASVAEGGQAGRYGLLVRGKALTASHIEELDDSEIERLYARYEARLGAAMTKTLGSAALQLYAGVVSMFLPIPAENQPGLIADLEGDPFVGHALSSATCELYHRYAMFLAPLTTALTTIKHCQFGHRCPAVIYDGNQADGGEPAGSSGGTARRNSFASGAGTC